MTKRRAKAIGIEVWDYLAKHGEIDSKHDLPKKIFNKIKKLQDCCSLCQYHKERNELCRSCILAKSDNMDYHFCGYYYYWAYSRTWEDRVKYAAIIRDKIKAW